MSLNTTVQEGDLLWTPSPERIEHAQVTRFMTWLRRERGLHLADYNALWQWSVDELDAFWAAIWDYFEVTGDGRFDRVRSGDGMFLTRFFEGAHVNYAEHLLRHEQAAAPDEVAFHHSSEIRPAATMTWRELGDRVRTVATRLRELGIRPGDRIVSYMPNVPETAVAMMATVAIGAIWSAASPEFGRKTVIERFSQIAPRLVLATDGYQFGGKSFDRRDEVVAIVEALPSVERVVWLPYLGLPTLPVAQDRVPAMRWDDLVAGTAPSAVDFHYERVTHDHPLWVLYSSGTTGLPKAIVHSHVGMVVEHLKVMQLNLDLGPGKRMFFYSTTGWMMWNSVIASLISGASAVLYDGSPVYPKVDALWDLCETSGTTLFGASPTLVQMMEKAGVSPRERVGLQGLDTVILGGAPSSPHTFEWFYQHVKEDLWVTSQSGGTDLCSGLVNGVPILPVRAGEIQSRALGMSVQAWDDDGRPLIDAVGELVVTKPFPTMPLYFWGDVGNRRYHESYFETFPGVWRHGDFIKITSHGGCYVYGRADATLNRYGVRIGTAEIYGPLRQLPEILDALVVCCETPGGGYYMPMFVALQPGNELDDELRKRIADLLRKECSPRHVPDEIHAVPGIPYTLTGKMMEVPVRKLLMGVPLEKAASRDSMGNPDVVEWFYAFAHRPEVRQRFAGS